MKETMKEKMKKRLARVLGNESGVTLIELLAVVIILAIIAAVGIPAVMNNINSSKTNTDTQNEKIITDAINRMVTVESDTYSTITFGGSTLDNSGSDATVTFGTGSSSTTQNLSTVLTTSSYGGPYLTSIPSSQKGNNKNWSLTFNGTTVSNIQPN